MHYFASQQDEISGRWLCRPIRVFTSSDGVETAQVSVLIKSIILRSANLPPQLDFPPRPAVFSLKFQARF
ncbi:hypothetical protein TWF132_008202 [Orbilia oligospora]|nr:hypothetical protein TWF132_008202 [Orbilia oligospora]